MDKQIDKMRKEGQLERERDHFEIIRLPKSLNQGPIKLLLSLSLSLARNLSLACLHIYHSPSGAGHSWTYTSQWIQNNLTINFWTNQMQGGRVFQTMGIKEGGERASNVTGIITLLNGDFTVTQKQSLFCDFSDYKGPDHFQSVLHILFLQSFKHRKNIRLLIQHSTSTNTFMQDEYWIKLRIIILF